MAMIDPDTDVSVTDEKRERGLKYVSKSRIKTYLQCPYKFYAKYWCENRSPGTIYTERGKQVHEAYEVFGENLMDHIDEHGERPERYAPLLPEDRRMWQQWLDPYMANFFKFEERRWTAAEETVARVNAMLPQGHYDSEASVLDAWRPIAVEAEAWLGEPPEDYKYADPDHINDDGPPVGDIPWMGKADLIVHTASIPGVTGSGVTIVDYKTGNCPTIKYAGAPFLQDILDEGIFLEGEYYGWLFEQFYDVDYVAGYFPKDDELILSEYPNRERRFDIKRAALGMQKQPEPEVLADAEVPENFDYKEQPLCGGDWGNCFFYGKCPSTKMEK